jgi:hypothetical protein
MANFQDCPHFNIHDDYYTPKSAWEQVNHLIPKDEVVWEACMLNSYQSKSPEYLTELGNNVIFNYDQDILLDHDDHYDRIITNPPFDRNLKIPILKRLVELDKPFMLIMNAMNLFTKYLREIFKDKFKDLQIITPSKKINFDKLDYETHELTPTKNCSFYCVYLCYKWDIPNEQLWLV